VITPPAAGTMSGTLGSRSTLTAETGSSRLGRFGEQDQALAPPLEELVVARGASA
jgi:hypothetical protein